MPPSAHEKIHRVMWQPRTLCHAMSYGGSIGCLSGHDALSCDIKKCRVIPCCLAPKTLCYTVCRVAPPDVLWHRGVSCGTWGHGGASGSTWHRRAVTQHTGKRITFFPALGQDLAEGERRSTRHVHRGKPVKRHKRQKWNNEKRHNYNNVYSLVYSRKENVG